MEMNCESDKHSIIFRAKRGSDWLQFYNSGPTIQARLFGRPDLCRADAEKLAKWLNDALQSDRPFTLRNAGGGDISGGILDQDVRALDGCDDKMNG